jgi:hypothetical protein
LSLNSASAQDSPGPIRLVFWFVAWALLGIWPALTNGQPFFFSDTTAYVRGADLAVANAFGNRYATEWAKDQRRTIGIQASLTDGGQLVREQKPAQRIVLAGRSIIYGALLYLGALTGGMWVSIVVQSLAAVYLIFLIVVRTLGLDFRHFLVIYGVLLLASPMPFFVSDLMPDVFAGLLILGFTILSADWEHLSLTELAITSGIILFATLSHPTHVLLLIALTASTAAYVGLIQRSRWKWFRRLVGVAGVCIVLSLLWEAAFSFAVTRVLGTPPVRPPFVSARLVSMLGAPAVSRVCASQNFVVCRFQDRFPTDTDTFLWSEDGRSGVFNVADTDTKLALSSEQIRFARAMFFQNPGRCVSGLLQDSFRQLTTFGLNEYYYSVQDLVFFESRLPARDFEKMKTTLAAWSLSYVVFGNTVLYTTAALGAMAILVLLFSGSRVGSADSKAGYGNEGDNRQYNVWRAVTGILLGGVVMNAIICGGLSAVNNRYEARVIWLVQLSSLMGIYVMRRQWKVASLFRRELEKKIAMSGL